MFSVQCTVTKLTNEHFCNKKLSDSIWLTKSNESNREHDKKRLLIRWRSRVSTSAHAMCYSAMVHSFHKASLFSNSEYFFSHISQPPSECVCVSVIVYAFSRANCVCGANKNVCKD